MSKGSLLVLAEQAVLVIAEIGINHNGDLATAKHLVDSALSAGADCVKFQVRDLHALYAGEADANNSKLDIGAQYTLDLLNRFQLTQNEYRELFEYCERQALPVLCTPWDSKSLEYLGAFEFPAYKVASADMTNTFLLEDLIKTNAELIISTGMSNESEIDGLVEFLEERNVTYALLHCNSTYPSPFHGLNLNYLHRLRKKIPNRIVGYSGHERGFSVPIAAVALGARIIEKHITLDRSMEGNDHKVSLLPDEFGEMVKEIRNISQSLGSDGPRVMSVGEKMNRENLAKSVTATVDLEPGIKITREMIEAKSPGDGVQPNRSHEMLGRTVRRAVKKDSKLSFDDFNEGSRGMRSFKFSRKYGVPVRFHDCEELLKKANLDFVEFHLSYKDVDGFPENSNLENHDLPFVVHTPDLFEGDHLIDFAAEDVDYRSRSIREIQRVIDLTRSGLAPYFQASEPIKIVASLGGFTREQFAPESELPELYERVKQSISCLDLTDVELLPQTLPPFPWYFGGQLFCNLFVRPEDSVEFCQENGLRLCFDVSHSKLACNKWDYDFEDFVETVAPVTGHLHIVDASMLDGEGLQIGEGSIDFKRLFMQLDQYAVDAWFIPEIWQGHKNGGAGFWDGLGRLSEILRTDEC